MEPGRRGAPQVRRTHGGRRLEAAFANASWIPALAEARERLLWVLEETCPDRGGIANVIESDMALTASVMRSANQGPSPTVTGIPQAIEILGVAGLAEAVYGLQTYPLFERTRGRRVLADRLSINATATRAAVQRIVALTHLPNRDELSVTALLHNIGMFGIASLDPELLELTDGLELTVNELVSRERLEFGLDHALLGGVLARRWKLPDLIARGIERHHAEDADGIAAVIRLADMVVHHERGGADDPQAVARAAESIGLRTSALHDLFYPRATDETARRPNEPSPLSARELEVLSGLGEGMLQKQIAVELGISASTVRSHLHSVYRKIGVADRVQAVLMARDRNWI